MALQTSEQMDKGPVSQAAQNRMKLSGDYHPVYKLIS